MYPFTAPAKITISGTTGSGKTTWLLKLLQNQGVMFDIAPIKILYCYGVWQPLFEEMQREIINISFQEGLPTEELMETFNPNGEHCLVILDDLAHLVMKSNEMETFYTRLSHHKQISIIFLNQNMFHQGKNARTINLNTHFMVLLKKNQRR